MKNMVLLVFVLLLVACCMLYVAFGCQKREQTLFTVPVVKINNITIPVEISDTPAKQVQGLSDRAELDSESGMLFIFPDKRIRQFWMKNMHFPIDIIWINDDKIVNISKNLPPEGELPDKTYSSESDVNYVLEVNAGFCDGNGIKTGDKIIHDL